MIPTQFPLLASAALATLWILGPTFTPAAGPDPEGVEFFERKVRPILVEHCHKCHAGDKKKGNLQLDSRANLLKGGDSGPAIVPGQPDQSLLIKAIRYTEEALRMPPKSKLAPDHIADLTAWVAKGAPWPESAPNQAGPSGKAAFNLKERSKHWAWQPLQAVSPPAVKQLDWIQSPIDRFLLARLEAAGLTPARPADRGALLRRVTFDLIGLPPTRQEIDAFLADPAPDAFAKVVEGLLASPHYGERWGRHWLDLVRYAETLGHEFDFELPHAHEYRDYVIRAFNADVPYDQLVTEHIAGDLMAEPRRHPGEGFNESILGTGFWFLGEAAHSPVDVRADESNHIDNQIDVLAKAFLGLTVSCARCHDHKFDAISTKDYYSLAGYLESSRQQHAFIDAPERAREPMRQLRQVQDRLRPVAVRVAVGRLEQRVEKLAKYLLAGRLAARTGLEEAVREFQLPPAALDRWLMAFQKAEPRRTDSPFHPWVSLAGEDLASHPQRFAERRQELVQNLKEQTRRATPSPPTPLLRVQGRGEQVVFEDFKKATYSDWFVSGDAFATGPSPAPEVLFQSDSRRPVRNVVSSCTHSGLVSNQLNGVLRSRTFLIDKRNIFYHVGGRNCQINLIIDNYQLIRDPIYGGLTIQVDHGDRLVWRGQDVSMWLGQRAYIEIIDDGPGYIAVDKIVFSDDGPPPEAPNQLLLNLLDDPELDSAAALARKYQELFLEILGQWRAGTLGTARDRADRLALLNWMLGDEALATLDSSDPAGAPDPDRQQLANLFDQLHQAEARLPAPRRALAMADGTGWNDRVHIRGNHKNLGEEAPRRFLEALAGSQQPPPRVGSGRLELARRMVDPGNPLLPRVLVNRLWQHHFGEGIVRSVDNFGVLGELPTHPELLDFLAREFMRRGWSIKEMHRLLVLSAAYQMSSRADNVLAEQRDPHNKLLHRMPIRRLEAEAIRDAILAVSGRLDRTMGGPSVLPYLSPHMVGRGRPANSGPLDGAGRRSVYLGVRRNFLSPLFLAFDYPTPFTTMGRRSFSNVPSQALALMNNPLVVQQAQTWADRVLAEPGLTPSRRVVMMYWTAFGRAPEDAELAAALAFLHEQCKGYGRTDDPRAWADLGHVLMNVKEFIFIN